jgi:MFS superfamily sulfate permease-like transporter
LLGDAFSIALVSFALNISMSKLFAKKYKYDLEPNQEAFAYGVGNLVTSFFKGFPSCVALSRSAILDGVGGKTQVFGLVSSVLMLIVCLVVGPLFKTLPNVSQFNFYF